ncbi:putative flavoprotein [Poronia punctata]|nr:putative flavoprotein [Poronia punctata]
MLQTISHEHDRHHTEAGQKSIESLTASLGDGKIHLLLASSGSVATIKLPNIIQALSTHPSSRLSIRVILTSSASRFVSGQSHEQPNISTLTSYPNVDAVYIDADEWKDPWVRGSGILHIELRRWADLLVIAPLSANTMARIVNGFADNLLTSVVRAWDPWGELDPVQAPEATTTSSSAGNATVISMTLEGTGGITRNRRTRKRRIIVAPAMNTAMWRHPITAKQLRVLEEEWGVQTSSATDSKERYTQADISSVSETQGRDQQQQHTSQDDETGDGWFEVLRPKSKVLACGDTGDGAMIEWTQIVTVIEERLGLEVGDGSRE